MDAIEKTIIEKENRIFVLELYPDDAGDASNPLDNSDSNFIAFSSREQHDSWKSKVSLRQSFFVDKYDHSAVHYSVAGSVQYPDDRWDVSHECAVITPSKDLRANANIVARREKRLFLDVLKEKINTELDEYSKWCNGEVYGFSIKELAKMPIPGKDPIVLQEESSWGFIGSEAATEAAKDNIKYMLNTALSAPLDIKDSLVSKTSLVPETSLVSEKPKFKAS